MPYALAARQRCATRTRLPSYAARLCRACNIEIETTTRRARAHEDDAGASKSVARTRRRRACHAAMIDSRYACRHRCAAITTCVVEQLLLSARVLRATSRYAAACLQARRYLMPRCRLPMFAARYAPMPRCRAMRPARVLEATPRCEMLPLRCGCARLLRAADIHYYAAAIRSRHAALLRADYASLLFSRCFTLDTPATPRHATSFSRRHRLLLQLFITLVYVIRCYTRYVSALLRMIFIIERDIDAYV